MNDLPMKLSFTGLGLWVLYMLGVGVSEQAHIISTFATLWAMVIPAIGAATVMVVGFLTWLWTAK